MSWATFWRRILTPIAVISTASDDASLSGLYATFSITTPRTVHTTIATINAANTLVPLPYIILKRTYPPIIITSPWAKLSILAIP